MALWKKSAVCWVQGYIVWSEEMLLGDGKPKGQAGGQCCLLGEFYAAEVNLNT